MSEQVERRIIELLDHPSHSPYGNPIPGLDELGEKASDRFSDGVVDIVNLVHGAVGSVNGTIRRLGEPAQYEPEQLDQLRAAGVLPGARAVFVRAGAAVRVEVAGYSAIELPNAVAVHVYVGTSGALTA